MILINRDQLASEVSDLLGQLTGVLLQPQSAVLNRPSKRSPHTSRVVIVGSCSFEVWLHCSDQLARHITASMMGMQPEEVAEADLVDVVNEVTNVTAGWVLRYLPEGLELAPPQHVRTAEPHSPLLAVSLACIATSQLLSIAIHAREPNA